MFFREFAETVLHKFGYDVGSNFMRGNPEDYTEEELTFYWSEEDYRQFLKELKEYENNRHFGFKTFRNPNGTLLYSCGGNTQRPAEHYFPSQKLCGSKCFVTLF